MTNLTREEHLLLELAPKCDVCGHSSALHNGHCCVFCTVPGCSCDGNDDGISQKLRDEIVNLMKENNGGNQD